VRRRLAGAARRLAGFARSDGGRRPLDVAPNATIDPDSAGANPAARRMPEAFARLEAPPTFITGHARSGTSWTLDLFDRHPDVCAIFEPWLFTQTRGITAVLTQPQWNPIFYNGQLEKLGVEHGMVQLLSYDELTRDLGELTAGWLMRAARPEHRFLVEKSPLDVAAVDALFPEARVVHVIRDGRDVALSMDKAAESWAPGMRRGVALAERGARWRAEVEEYRSAASRLGAERYLEIRFEDLKSNFHTHVRRLFDFAGVPSDDATLDLVSRETQLSSYPAGSRASGFRGGGRAAGWRERFSKREAFAFDHAAGEMLVDLGYAPDRRWWREA
jgi:hypothetical protein